MANTKSAIKRIKVSSKKHERNQAVKSSARTFVRRARTAITGRASGAPDDVKAAVVALDKAAKKGVIHANNAARRKSRLMKLYNVSVATPQVASDEAQPKRKATRSKKAETPAEAKTAPKATSPRGRKKADDKPGAAPPKAPRRTKQAAS